MTRTEAEALAKTALPCPFCGEQLEAVCAYNDRFCVGHPEDCQCFFFGHDIEIVDENQMSDWNRRTPKEQ